MKWWRNSSTVLRRLMALAMLTAFFDAAALGAAECEVDDIYGEPRECTFSERLGECGLRVLDSLIQCLENEPAGFVSGVYCHSLATLDLVACSAEVPIDWFLE